MSVTYRLIHFCIATNN